MYCSRHDSWPPHQRFLGELGLLVLLVQQKGINGERPYSRTSAAFRVSLHHSHGIFEEAPNAFVVTVNHPIFL